MLEVKQILIFVEEQLRYLAYESFRNENKRKNNKRSNYTGVSASCNIERPINSSLMMIAIAMASNVPNT